MSAKIAPVTPAYCSVCYQAGGDKTYVDFGSAWDGPVLTLEDGRKQPIDDLVVCSGCLAEAFDLLDPQGLKDRIAQLEGQVEQMAADISAKDGVIQRFGITTEELIRHPIERQAGYAAVTGVPDEVATFLNLRKEDRKKKNRKEGARKAQDTMAKKAAAK